jgi:multiple sugar transport system permease protein
MLDSTPKEAQFDLNDWLSWLNPLLLLVGAGVVLAPLLVVFLTSLTPPGSVSGINLAQSEWTWANYQEAWRRGNFLLAFANSTLVALASPPFRFSHRL